MDNIYIHSVLLALIIITSIFAVSYARVIRGAILLGIVSLLLSISLFILSSPLAAMFELSVCAGLITVIFVSVISLTNPPTDQERKQNEITMFKKIIFLFVFAAVCAISLYILNNNNINFVPLMQNNEEIMDTRDTIWHMRHVDLIGQALILLTGIFGVVVLFKKKQG